jgi:hypothetical protein
LEQSSQTIAGFGNRAIGTCNGITAASLFESTGQKKRAGVEIHNADAAFELWIRATNTGDPAPTITSADRDFVIAPKSTISLAYGDGITLYAINSSGGVSATPFVAREVRS